MGEKKETKKMELWNGMSDMSEVQDARGGDEGLRMLEMRRKWKVGEKD